MDPKDSSRDRNLTLTLFFIGVGVYLVTRLWDSAAFPIFFFCDEAFFQVHAEALLNHHLRNSAGELFPMFYEKAPDRWVPQFPLYIYLLPTWLFGKSVEVTRGVAAVVSLLAPLSCCYVCRAILKIRSWWLPVLILAIMPVWIIHSRTAFDNAFAMSFYACFLAAYWTYRCGHKRALYVTVLCGALAGYSHFSGTIAVLTSALLFLVFDLSFHLRQWRKVVLAAFLLCLLSLPAYRLMIQSPSVLGLQLRVIDSSWMGQKKSLGEKIEEGVARYRAVVNPKYWFTVEGAKGELERHQWKDSPWIQQGMFPLFLIGVLLCLRRIRAAPYKLILCSLAASLSPTLLVGVGIMRVFYYIVPATMLITIGADWFVELLRKRVGYVVLSSGLCFLFSFFSLRMLTSALVEGPRWFNNYGLYGMQYGADAFFGAIREVLAENAQARVLFSCVWANGIEQFPPFFLDSAQLMRVVGGSATDLLQKKQVLNSNMIFALTADEVSRVRSSGKFSEVNVFKTIPYPDGQPGFEFFTAKYVDNIDEIFRQDAVARQELLKTTVDIGGEMVEVKHSRLDIGRIENVFDGDPNSLARGMEANPFVFELTFPKAHTFSGMKLDPMSINFTWTLEMIDPSGEIRKTYSGRDDTHGRSITAINPSFPDSPEGITKVRLSISEIDHETSNVHISNLEFLEAKGRFAGER